jgi:hypothetical protein
VSGVLEFNFINEEEMHAINNPKSGKEYCLMKGASSQRQSRIKTEISSHSLEPETEPIDYRFIT